MELDRTEVKRLRTATRRCDWDAAAIALASLASVERGSADFERLLRGVLGARCAGRSAASSTGELHQGHGQFHSPSSTRPSWCRLCPQLRRLVLSYSTALDRCRTMSISKEGSADAAAPELWANYTLDLHKGRGRQRHRKYGFALAQFLKTRSLGQWQLTPALVLPMERVTATTFPRIAALFSSLVDLDASHVDGPADEVLLWACGNCHRLSRLAIGSAKDVDFSLLGQLQGLKKLTVRYCACLTDGQLRALRDHVSLEWLELGSMGQCSEAGLQNLRHSRSLRKVRLQRGQHTSFEDLF